MNIAQILQAKFPGAEWVLTGEDYEGLEWLDKSKKPGLKELEKVWPDIKAAQEKSITKSMRRNAYRELSDPLFFQWQAGEVTEAEWLNARADVVKKFPYSS